MMAMKSAAMSADDEHTRADLRMRERGMIQVPPHFRRAHKLSKGSRLVAIELGSGLMLVPLDRQFERASRRIGQTLQRHGITPERAMKNLEEVRRRRFERLHGNR